MILKAEKAKRFAAEDDDPGMGGSGESVQNTTIRRLVHQQMTTYKNMTYQIADRIVNLYQDHFWPIVRGEAGAAVDFGAKVVISLENGYSRIEKLSWDSHSEANTLMEKVENFRSRNGCYREAVLTTASPGSAIT